MKSVQFIILIFLSFSPLIRSQFFSQVDLFTGYGYYEGFVIGSEYCFKQKKHSLNLYTGFDNFNEHHNYTLSAGYNLGIFENRKNYNELYKWQLCATAVYWYLEDEYYIWQAISLVPSLQRNLFLTGKIRIAVNAGPSFNIILYNKRKTFKEVGWPYHIMPEFRILLII